MSNNNNNWKKRAEELPHYEPEHVTQGKTLDDVLNGIPGLPSGPIPQQQQAPSPSGPERNQDNFNPFSGQGKEREGWKDINTDNMFQKILAQRMQGQMMPTGDSVTAPMPSENSNSMVYLKEGQEAFRQLQAPNSQVPLAIRTGPVAGVAGREFEFKGTRKFYIIENQQQSVDMSNIDHSKLIKLAVVSAPFIGTFLVPESAVIRQSAAGPQLLKG